MTIRKDILTLLPSFGILIFAGLYVYSASLYPGGSQADLNSVGFDWLNNYWCNLMSEKAMNGQENPARPVALVAMVILCSSMTLFFFQFANYFVKNRNWKITIKIAGTLAMLSAVFIFTMFHDVMTTILSICGVIGIIGIIRALHKNKMTFFKVSGIICMMLIGIINLFYYNENLIKLLPFVQMAAFILILAWTVGLNLKMKNKS
ncbi:hypothetical protein J1N09_04345 [Aureitalea sp. L0-47]|uniref:hypothetical protein n=1 Tax=Aureitalea sp. L0-47 TaxID=2816962 RepID=UPI002237377C|nr:hypothetical protein [Aureitalea sp. L0-47]MCW5519055.1 hypothetical protein [Aureitalea sp. L0-47]